LKDVHHAVIDTNVFIYLFEDHRTFGPVAEFVVEQAASGAFTAVITPVTIAELLVKPLQADRPDVADKYRTAVTHIRGITPVSIDPQVGTMAGALRAKYGLPLPDMLQAAVALAGQPPTVITNDRSLRRVSELRIVTLEDF
jgi:predicted nucleic acid-binding protein